MPTFPTRTPAAKVLSLLDEVFGRRKDERPTSATYEWRTNEMADRQHPAIVNRSVTGWNAWRRTSSPKSLPCQLEFRANAPEHKLVACDAVVTGIGRNGTLFDSRPPFHGEASCQETELEITIRM